MVKKHAVILPSRYSKTFDRFKLPDGSTALAVDAHVYRDALAAADETLERAMQDIKDKARSKRHVGRTAA